MSEERNMTSGNRNKLVSDKSNTFFTENRIMRGSSIPTEGTYLTGDIMINNSSTSTDEPMWICNEGGTPGKWGPISSAGANATIVPTYAAMMASKAAVGTIFYVIADETDDGSPGFYIVTSIKGSSTTEGLKVPDTVDKINKKENNVPTLSYDPSMPEGSKIYLNDNDDLILKFNFSSGTYGDGKYRIYRDGVLIRSWNAAKGSVLVNLGPITSDGTYNISVTATDYLTIPAPETLYFTVIVGGLKLSSTFDETLLSSVFEEGDIITFPFSATVADSESVMKLAVNIMDTKTGNIVSEDTVTLNGTSVNTSWDSDPITARGQYRLTAQVYTGVSLDDTTEGVFTSNILTYEFKVLRENEIAILSELKLTQIDNNTYLSVPFRVSSRIANYFIVRGELERNNSGTWELVAKTSDAGISTAVNITNYWSVGKQAIGEYRITLRAYTVDGGVESLESAVNHIQVVQSTYQRVEPVKSNLIAWFDANNMRNNDEQPELWRNAKGLEDIYAIRLHNLNYNSNGWKHIDPTLSDEEDGEMMLKMNGESYGELVKIVNNREIQYEPFSVFNNSGQTGFTLETAIRTRNIGELNARVITCMNGDKLDAPGIAISHNLLALGTDSQVNTLDFVEDEWVHVTFVIDRDIRLLDDIGQDNIENLNPVGTLRIYINGVLCACSALKQDRFLDASGMAYPLLLNACKLKDAVGNIRYDNFGECEIKFIRIYNSFLRSSDVLNNYIAHIYEQEEQQRMVDRNDVGKASLPTIVFRRNLVSSNQSTFGILNSITDKKMSKKTCVDCTMEFDDGEGNIIVYENVDVYLQGTSSLQYPVKNYKIKCYNDVERTSKNKIVPPSSISEKWTPDYTYTLKCDYMEHSHKNNTPTARFFNQIVDRLGGESPARKDGYHDAIDGFPCIVYYNDGTEENTLVGSFMFNVDKSGKELGFECDLYDESGNVVGSGKDSCVSYEGTANASDTAGCFFKLEESINNVYQYYIENEYKEYLKESGLTSDRYSIDDFRRDIYDGLHEHVMSFDEFVADYDETDYIMADFEARYSFNEDDEKATYKPMIDLVNWVSDSIKAGTFKKDFEAHLDLKYMLAYYLQMMVFTQVDNCGKNCMWDTWDGVKFYPRPYDMDTSMGLSNTGTETIRVDAELLPELSPFEVEGGTHSGYYNNDTTTDLRYLSFNTKTSKLWNAFTEEFQTEIKDSYRVLRNAGVFTVDNILKNATSITDDMIGEIYFNKDAASKYLSQTNEKTSEYLKMLHGNRVQKYKKFLRERIIFLDTIYDYMESDIQFDSLNSIITLRSDVLYGQSATETMKCYLGISSYSPQYVSIAVGSGQDAIITAYVGPESRYIDPDTGMECEGTLFSFPIRGTDKEMTISGAGNIKDLAKIQQLNVRDLIITKAERLLSLDLSYSSRMTALSMGNNKYLRSLNCSNSYLLGTSATGQTIDLSKCINLREVNLSKTKITGIIFPQDNIIKSVNLTGSSIKNIEIDGAEFLTEIKIEDCENINKFSLNRCNKIYDVNVANSTIQNFIVTNCINVNSIDISGCKSIAVFDVTNCDAITTLNLKNNSSPVMQDLKLYSMYNLKTLNASQTTTLHTIRLPKYLNAIEAFKASNGEPALPWNVLKTLNLNSSSIRKIQYGSADVDHTALDLGQLDSLTSINIQKCTSMTEVRNINFKGNLANLFYDDNKLVKVSGTLTNTSANVNSMFSECHALSDISGLTFNFTNVTSAQSTFHNCKSVKTMMVKKLLDACGSSLTSIASICLYAGNIGGANDPVRKFPSNMFENTPNISNMSGAFNYSGFTSIPGDALDPVADKLTNLSSAFAHNGSLTTVGNTLLKNKPKLTNVASLFYNDGNLKHFIDTDPNIFEGSPNITTTSNMFVSCHNLLTGENGLGEMMYPLVNLTTCAYMFFQCYNNFTAPIPEGFLSKNTKLVSINGLFQRCRKIPTLPKNLFRVNITDTNTFPNLVEAMSVFADCRTMTGIVESTFFIATPNISNLGMRSKVSLPIGGNSTYHEGFFYNTKITGYHETFLNPLTKLTSVSNLFAACTELEDCYYYDGRDLAIRGNGISPDLFACNPLITDFSRAFCGCSKLEGCIPSTLFDTSKAVLTDVYSMFEGCKNLSGIDLDAVDDDNTLVGVSSQWFKNAYNLLDASRFMFGDNSYRGTFPEKIFEGCSKLTTTASMFYECGLIEGGIPLRLFEDCRDTISNISSMFYGCVGLTDPIPTGEYNTYTGIIAYKLVPVGTEGALQVVETMLDPFTQIAYADVINMSPNLATSINANGGYYVKAELGKIVETITKGLLTDCTNLTTVNNLFHNCTHITGAIPYDLFYTSSQSLRFNKLTDMGGLFYNCDRINEHYIDEESGAAYICSPTMFEKCPAVTTFGSMFYHMDRMDGCEVHPSTFDKQNKLTNIGSMFAYTGIVGNVSNLFKNSLGTLTHAGWAFAYTSITNVSANFLSNGATNKKIKYIGSIFQGCSALEGTSPEFWNGVKFPAIELNQSGYWGALAGCTKLSNYELAKSVSPNWTTGQ